MCTLSQPVCSDNQVVVGQICFAYFEIKLLNINNAQTVFDIHKECKKFFIRGQYRESYGNRADRITRSPYRCNTLRTISSADDSEFHIRERETVTGCDVVDVYDKTYVVDIVRQYPFEFLYRL